VWLGGGVFFEHYGVVYPQLGFQFKASGDSVKGSVEILSSELEAARQAVLGKRKAA
jgi:hypothetical protein